jgi:ribosome-associated protein
MSSTEDAPQLVAPTDNIPASEDLVHWAQVAARAADDKLAINTLVIDVADVIAITDVFLITAGSNPRQVRAIANNIEEMVVRKGGPKALRREGHDTFEWVLIDFGGFICHVFEAEHRAYYELERLWGDRPRITWAADEPSADEPSADEEE